MEVTVFQTHTAGVTALPASSEAGNSVPEGNETERVAATTAFEVTISDEARARIEDERRALAIEEAARTEASAEAVIPVEAEVENPLGAFANEEVQEITVEEVPLVAPFQTPEELATTETEANEPEAAVVPVAIAALEETVTTVETNEETPEATAQEPAAVAYTTIDTVV